VKDEKPVYYSFLLRLWMVHESSGDIWRASIEYPETGERRGFSSLEEFIHYLQTLVPISPEVEPVEIKKQKEN